MKRLALPPRRRTAGFRSAVIGVFVAALAIAGSEPPSPRTDAPPGDFSAIRAARVLQRIAGNGVPRPEGSAEAELARNAVAAEFRALGDDPVIEPAFACNDRGVCGSVRNLVVRRGTAEKGKAILLSAHLDSVAAGPGASDDAMGVAALVEIARALRVRPLRRPVTLLIDDGEEQGLLGAEAFAARAAETSLILADINIEARGTGGPSLLFETSSGNAWLAREFGSLPRPVTSSLFYAVYKALPNDTDLTVFRRHGMAGVNFGCVRGVSRYHTPRDDVAHANLATLQHHGGNALALARALDASGDGIPPAGDSVYFDLFGRTVVRWPAALCLPVALASAALFAVGLVVSRRLRPIPRRAPAWVFLTFPAMLVTAAGAALLLGALLRKTGVFPSGWIAHPLAPAAALWGAALVWGAFPASRAGSYAAPETVGRAVAGGWIASAIAAAAISPSASFPFLVPAALRAVEFGVPRARRWAGSAARVATAFFWLPIAWALLDVLGFRGAAVIGTILGLVVSAWAEPIARIDLRLRRALPIPLAAGVAALAVVSVFLRPFSPDVPQRLSFVAHRDADSGLSRWLAETDADSLPPGLGGATSFRREREFPWSPESAFAAPAPRFDLPAPEFRIRDEGVADGGRRVSGRIVSLRGAPIVRVAFPAGARPKSVVFGGIRFPGGSLPSRGLSPGWTSYVCVTTPPGGIEFEAVLPPGPATLILADRSPGLPAAARFLLGARPEWAVPSQLGDGTVVTRSIRF